MREEILKYLIKIDIFSYNKKEISNVKFLLMREYH